MPPHRRSLAGRGILLFSAGLVLLASPGARAGGISAHAFQFRIGQPGAFIKTCWNRPRAVPSSSILGYVIWRRDLFSPLQVVGGRDGDTGRCFIDSEATRTFFAYDGAPASDDAGGRTSFTAPGLVPGQQYGFQVAAAYRNGLEDRDGDGMPDQADFMSPLSLGSGLVTAIAPPVISAVAGVPPTNGQLVDLSNLQVEWQQTPGADRYVIWVSRDPTFRRGRMQFHAEPTFPVDQGGPATQNLVINASRGKLRRAGLVFITVGARSSRDPRPRPFGAIFSAPVSVRPETAPPPPP